MASPYSYDLRAKVLQAIDGGMTKSQGSRVFSISRNTINLWLKRREETGDYKAKDKHQKGYQPKIAD
jgi:transposase